MSASYEAELARAVQWYPGHMVKAMQRIKEALALVDVVIETIDARAARSGGNPLLIRMLGRRRRIVALTREDLASPAVTRAWLESFERRHIEVAVVDARSSRSAGRVARLLRTEPANAARAMVLGIPNSGKSSVVNSLLHRSAARVENRAGVTRHAQWFRLSSRIELLDTPGVLPPRIGRGAPQWKLAAVGAVPSSRFEAEEVARRLSRWATRHGARGVPDFDEFVQARGFVSRKGAADEHNAAQSYLRNFAKGAFGRISLESPDDEEAA